MQPLPPGQAALQALAAQLGAAALGPWADLRDRWLQRFGLQPQRQADAALLTLLHQDLAVARPRRRRQRPALALCTHYYISTACVLHEDCMSTLEVLYQRCIRTGSALY